MNIALKATRLRNQKVPLAVFPPLHFVKKGNLALLIFVGFYRCEAIFLEGRLMLGGENSLWVRIYVSSGETNLCWAKLVLGENHSRTKLIFAVPNSCAAILIV